MSLIVYVVPYVLFDWLFASVFVWLLLFWGDQLFARSVVWLVACLFLSLFLVPLFVRSFVCVCVMRASLLFVFKAVCLSACLTVRMFGCLLVVCLNEFLFVRSLLNVFVRLRVCLCVRLLAG